jgi:hypothetical protein
MVQWNIHWKHISIILFSWLGYYIKDRPFNLKGGEGGYGFLFRSEFFFRITQELALGYMTKTLNQIFFFFLHQNQNIFFSNIGNQNIFLEKNHNLPLQVKWSFPYLYSLHPDFYTLENIRPVFLFSNLFMVENNLKHV